MGWLDDVSNNCLDFFLRKKKTKAQAPPFFGRALRKVSNDFYSRLSFTCLLLRRGGRGGPSRVVGSSRLRTHDLLEGCDGAVLLGQLANFPNFPSSRWESVKQTFLYGALWVGFDVCVGYCGGWSCSQSVAGDGWDGMTLGRPFDARVLGICIGVTLTLTSQNSVVE